MKKHLHFTGWFGMILMNGSAIPQLIKIIQTHSVHDLTLFRELFLLVGCASYLIYGFHRKDKVIIVSNLWACSMFLTLIALIIIYN